MDTNIDPVDVLKRGEITIQGEFLWGSNYTFLAEVAYGDQKVAAVYKPSKGERPLWDFPVSSLAKREVAAYQVSEALGWRIVPPTFYRKGGPLGAGSIQLYIEHDPEYHYFNFTEEDRQRLRPTVLFDLIINNADRKGSHVILDDRQHIWLIDHGICFHEEDKLRTVIWDFAGEAIPAKLMEDVRRMVGTLNPSGGLAAALKPYLKGSEIKALAARAERLLAAGRFPAPSGGRRVYPWPPV